MTTDFLKGYTIYLGIECMGGSGWGNKFKNQSKDFKLVKDNLFWNFIQTRWTHFSTCKHLFLCNMGIASSVLGFALGIKFLL